jgi:Sec-independent protein translocase protein TatA
MGVLSPMHWLIVLAIIVLLFRGKKIPRGGKGMRGGAGGPQHPIPVTGPIETEKPKKDSEEKEKERRVA